MSNIEYIQLDQREHMLLYAERDLGNTKLRRMYNNILYENKIISSNIIYNTAIERLYLEILYNAIDNVQRSFEAKVDPKYVLVEMNDVNISITNHGLPISCKKQSNSKLYIPTFIFGQLLTSSNYTGSRKVGGRFGIGCKAVNVFSVLFEIDIINVDEGVRFKQTWLNNMSEASDPIITECKSTDINTTKVSFNIDFSKFYDSDIEFGFAGKRQYTQAFMYSYAKYCVDCALTSNTTCIFNQHIFNNIDIVKYASYYFPNMDRKYKVYTTVDSTALFIDTPDDGKLISFVNGVINNNGGVHVDTWCKYMLNPIFKKLKKSYPKLTFKDIMQHYSLILMCRLINPTYDGQTKDRVTGPKPTVTEYDSELEKWNAYTHIHNLWKSKELPKAKLSDGFKTRRVNVESLSDADKAGTCESYKCTLYIVEGKSAQQFPRKISDPKYTGSLALRGKFVNVSKHVDPDSNEEIIKLNKTLGLNSKIDYSTRDSISNLRYGKLVILTDQDDDGMHIRGLLYQYFRTRFKDLLTKHSYVYVMDTPILRINNLSFFYEKEYIKWKREDVNRSKLKVKYFKGLASNKDTQIKDVFANSKYISLIYDDAADKLMNMAFDNGYEDMRKDWIKSWNSVEYISKYEYLYKDNTLSKFIMGPLCHFSYNNMRRCIPKYIDGLKDVQRKILYVVLKENTKSHVVSRISGRISDITFYKHGPQSLESSIISMTNDCIGTNNIPYMLGEGQFESRFGDDAGASRYISVKLHPLMQYIYRSEDECILEYNDDSNAEPSQYHPIIPMFAVNGSKGIGTGYSTDIPAYDPLIIIKYICFWMDGERLVLNPYWRNYLGKIEYINNRWYSIGSFERKSSNNIIITELPVTTTISKYERKLKTLSETPIMSTKEFELMKSKNPSSKAKCPMLINSYNIQTVTREVKSGSEFKIEIMPYITVEGVHKLDDVNIKQRLGLIEKISDVNITLLNKDSFAIEYNNIYDAINQYCIDRLHSYDKRRETQIKIWNDIIDKLKSKLSFVEAITSKRIIIDNKDDDEVARVMSENKFDLNLLTTLTYSSQTKNGKLKIINEIKAFEDKINDYKNTSSKSMWLRELKELYERYTKFY